MSHFSERAIGKQRKGLAKFYRHLLVVENFVSSLSFGNHEKNILSTYEKQRRVVLCMPLHAHVVEEYRKLRQIYSIRYFVEELEHPGFYK